MPTTEMLAQDFFEKIAKDLLDLKQIMDRSREKPEFTYSRISHVLGNFFMAFEGHINCGKFTAAQQILKGTAQFLPPLDEVSPELNPLPNLESIQQKLADFLAEGHAHPRELQQPFCPLP